MSSPFMQLYIGDYLRDTQGLSTEGHGAYLLILFAMWNADGWVSAEPRKMAQYARMTVTRWAKLAPDIMPFLIVEDGMASQKRLLQQLEKASGKSLKRSVAGKRGAEAKALKNNNVPQAFAIANANAIADGLHKHSPDTRNQRPESKKEEEQARSADADAHPGPVNVSRETPKEDLFDIGNIPESLDRRPKPGADIVPLVTQSEREIEAAVEAYNLTADFAKWPACQSVTEKRRKAIKSRLAEAGGLEGWKDGMRKAAQSSFLLGKTGRSGDHAQWRPNIDFFLQQSSFTKLMEGGYDDPDSPQGGGGQLGRLAEAAAFALAAGDPAHRTG